MSLQSRLQAGRPDDPREPREEPQRDFSGPSTAAPGSTDPFGELKTQIHHDIITRIGPRLFSADVRRPRARRARGRGRAPRSSRSTRRR